MDEVRHGAPVRSCGTVGGRGTPSFTPWCPVGPKVGSRGCRVHPGSPVSRRGPLEVRVARPPRGPSEGRLESSVRETSAARVVSGLDTGHSGPRVVNLQVWLSDALLRWSLPLPAPYSLRSPHSPSPLFLLLPRPTDLSPYTSSLDPSSEI